MKIIKEDIELINKVRKKAHVLGAKVFIVSKPEKAKSFLSFINKSISQTKNTYKKLINLVRLNKHLTHEVENLFDNYYIIDSAISDVTNTSVDKGFKKLFQIEITPNIYIPRIYSILVELLKVSEYKIDKEVLYTFLRAYQAKAHLSIRELSFVPFFLRIILIKNTESLMHKAIVSLNEYKDAEDWFDQIVKKKSKDKEKNYSQITSNLASKYGVIPVNLGFNLLQRLSQYGPDTRPIVKWLKLNLLKQGINISNLAEIENKYQTETSNQILNIINSLRWINQVRWDNFVVDINIVDSFLLKDPAEAYGTLDQASQAAYRNELVKISDRAGVYESEVAKLALRLCHTSVVSQENNNPENHIGYYLVGEGRNELEKKIGYQKPFLEILRSFVLSKAPLFYLGLILLVDIILTTSLVILFPNIFGLNIFSIILFILVFILNCDIVINLINLSVVSFIPVRMLPQLDLSSGVELRQSTFVVIPSMLRDSKNSQELLKRLEVNFLSNSDQNIYFALLMDFKDSKMETTTSDQILVEQMNEGIRELNKKYKAKVDRFYIFHRRRIWNPNENTFMCWERKRGKLREFNLLLRNIRPTSYFEALPKDLPSIKYVLTIDEDTRLPKDSAIKLIGCIDHPLNRPILDEKKGKVISGYGIIQPRMTTKFNLARATIFSRLFSFSIGIDSYTGPGADVYQDLFNNSLFFGKGIYDVDAMEATIGDRIPENQVLSHDLLEGLYTRVGFATDIYLFEGFPDSYKEYILRMHRWIRGDWQIISWLKFNKLKNNNFDITDKWKIFDNLRRSTLPIFAIFFLVFSYLFFHDYYIYSFVYILLVIGSSFIISYIIKLFEWPKEMTLLMKINNLFDNLDSVIWQIIYRFIFLLDQAIISLRAISISIYRMNFRHKNMLLWQNSHEVAKNLKGTLREFIIMMFPTQIIALALVFILLSFHDSFSPYFTTIFWFISPLVAYHISRKEKVFQYKKSDTKLLRGVACRSARFFLELARRDNNYLIPDHYQEEPVTNSRSATSPTNIGCHLLGNFSAYDLGYISLSNLLWRLTSSFRSLDHLERYKGHFYNWYDICTLQPLNPKYVSSVDSANLLLNLITLKQGILDIIGKPIISKASFVGFEDILNSLIDDACLIMNERGVIKVDRKAVRGIYNEARQILIKIKIIDKLESIECVSKVLNDLTESNEKMKRIVSNLNLGISKGILSSIYSSIEHFNTLLKQQIDELAVFMFYNQDRLAKPVIRNEKRNSHLAKTLKNICSKLDIIPSLETLNGQLKCEIEDLFFINLIHSASLDNDEKENIEKWYHQVITHITHAQNHAIKIKNEFLHIVSLANKFVDETNFAFLYNEERGLFHIGYNAILEKIDNYYYDFLASEANAISFMAVLKNDVPIKHWFYLSRKLVQLDQKNISLVSWGGSLFEYLTSLIFFKVHKESLLGRTANVAINAHIKYGKKYKIPWGMGESAYSALDLNNNYQYQIFGHPELGLKRDLKDYLVVAPYTTVLSLAFKPKEATLNMRKMIKSKFMGRYGFYDAIDYGAKLEDGSQNSVGVPAKIYYAHHQGFSLQSLNNQVNHERVHSLFLSDPRVEALDTIFEEKIPSSIPARPIKSIDHLQAEYVTTGNNDVHVKQFIPLYTSYPRRAFISNGSYFVDVSNTGAGGSRVADINLTRFREDTVAETWGQFIYLYDENKNNLWSPTTRPTGVSLGKNKIEYFENKARFIKIHNNIESSLTIAIAPDSNVEFRILTLTNHHKEAKTLNITSYGEVCLAKSNDDLHHTAFQKLFIKSEYWKKYNALVYSRPNNVKRGTNLYLAHKVFTSLYNEGESIYTTNRNQFIDRGGTLSQPDIFSPTHHQGNPDLGYNFDPIFSFQNQIELKSNEAITITYVNIFGNSQEELINNLKKYSNQKHINQAIIKSDKHSYDVVNSLGISHELALSYQALASRLLSPHYSSDIKSFRQDSHEAKVQTLWRIGISGDLPILIVRFYDMNDMAMVKNMLICHKYLKHKGIAHDLVLLNEYPTSYIKSFEDEVDFLIRYNQTTVSKTIRGNVFHIQASHLSLVDKEDLLLLSRVVIDSKLGTIEQQILEITKSNSKASVPYLKTTKKVNTLSKDTHPTLDKLSFYNGLGGFADDGREYKMNINYKKSLYTPCPWANIIANKNIGTVITESGSSYTWFADSYDNRLTKRIDDPLIDRSSEIFYLRDEETGDFWNPTPLPIKSPHTYIVSHGLGFTKFEHKSRGIDQSMVVHVPVEDNVKIVKFKFTNTTKIIKKLSLTGFFEMSVGGANRQDNKDYLKTTLDKTTGAIIVKNIFSESFKKVLAFVDLNAGNSLVTNDREEFLGKGGDVNNPAALHREKLSNIIHDDVDHCVALETFFTLNPGEEIEIISLLGGGYSIEAVHKLIAKYRSLTHYHSSLKEIESNWNNLLNKVQIKTPDQSLNILFNFRLIHQVMSSRLLARTGYYQPSGAYGFRDQLQDSMSLVWTNPEVTKEIILKASHHQFLEGDVQNWWHEHNSFGVRTVFSDQQLWLPYVVSFYLEITNDIKILDEKIPYLKGPLLDFISNSNWAGIAEVDKEKYDLYDHCLRAIEKTFVFGKNGLPIIGNGDWNDGLNKVGEKGQGESVWLGWFLCAVIKKFTPYIKNRGDEDRVKRFEVTLQNLTTALERKAWDGKWYKRAFYDNGVALGSSSNREFKIDSISQSWSVLSGVARTDRSKIAMNSVMKNLFQNNDLLLLIFPAVKDTSMDPGYIKDYPPGVRENGAQYNHGALWAAQAYAKLNDPLSAMKIIDSVNPIKRSESIKKASLYKVEPYVVASDIYAKPAPAGRGGWTWYTGSAGVMYCTILESILGIKIRNNKMEINPCIPKSWKNFSLLYTHKNTKYNIHILNNQNSIKENKKIIVNGETLSGDVIHLINDKKTHKVEVTL